jgi:hypothetical protein
MPLEHAHRYLSLEIRMLFDTDIGFACKKYAWNFSEATSSSDIDVTSCWIVCQIWGSRICDYEVYDLQRLNDRSVSIFRVEE